MNIFAHFTVLQRIQNLYCMCNTENVRRDAFFRNALILLRNFDLSSIAVNLFNFHDKRSSKKRAHK